MTRSAILAPLLAVALCGAAPAALAGPATGASGLKIVARIPGPDGGWDYASFDPVRRRLYVTHGLSVMMVAADTGAVTPAFAAGLGLHAVVPVRAHDVIVTTNSGDNSARIISAADGKLIASVATGTKPDAAVLDAASGLVVVANGASGDVTLVDVKARKSVGLIPVGGALEFTQTDGRGRLFINVENKNEIAVVDIAARKVVARWPLAGCDGPSGLAYVAANRLISSCSNGVAPITDAATGKLIASLKIGRGPDSVLYDPVRKLAYIPCGRDAVLEVIALSGPKNNTIIDTVATQTGARTGAVDTKTGRVYLPAAQYDPPAVAGQRPKMKPGTFEVLVLGR
jgi:DNA-binding beta-propeller fold protein YncE